MKIRPNNHLHQLEFYSVESVINGVAAPREIEDPLAPDRVWVNTDGQSECLRYWSAGLSESTPCAVFHIHGDRLWHGEVVAYDDNNSMAQHEYAVKAAESIGMAFIKIGRPGLYGSSGSHSASRQIREMQLMAAAVRAIIRRHGIKRYGFSGQSGGGSVAAFLMACFPEAQSVAFSAACLSLTTLKNAGGEASGYHYGASGIYNPIDHIKANRPISTRRLFVIGDEKDQSALFVNLVEYYEVAKSAGHNITLISTEAFQNHVLDSTGQHVVAWALSGISDAEIIRRIHAKDVIN